MENEKLSAEARMLDSQTRAQESQAKIELERAKLELQAGKDQGDPAKMAQLDIQRMDIQQRSQDALLDAVNRKRDRESRERLAAIKLAEELIRNPQGMPIANEVISEDMLSRLEGNEPTLDGRQTGEL